MRVFEETIELPNKQRNKTKQKEEKGKKTQIS